MTADERIDRVRDLLATVGANDVERALSFVTDDVMFVDVLAPLESTIRDVWGEEGFRAWFAGLHVEGVKQVTAEPSDLQDLGDGRVVGDVLVAQRQAGGSFAMLVYGIWRFDGDRISAINSYFDRELALRDAGLGSDSGLMRRWVEGVIVGRHEARRAVRMDAPEFDGNEFSVAGGMWEEMEVGTTGFAEVDHGQIVSWQPFDSSLGPQPADR